MTVHQAEKDILTRKPETMANTALRKEGNLVLESTALSPQIHEELDG